jgi:hypothetical protein
MDVADILPDALLIRCDPRPRRSLDRAKDLSAPHRDATMRT